MHHASCSLPTCYFTMICTRYTQKCISVIGKLENHTFMQVLAYTNSFVIYKYTVYICNAYAHICPGANMNMHVVVYLN